MDKVGFLIPSRLMKCCGDDATPKEFSMLPAIFSIGFSKISSHELTAAVCCIPLAQPQC